MFFHSPRSSSHVDALHVSVEVSKERHHLIALEGELDRSGVPQCEAIALRTFADEPRAVTVDLSALTFLASAGLSAILLLQRLADIHGCSFAVAPGAANIQHEFEIAGLQDTLPWARPVYVGELRPA